MSETMCFDTSDADWFAAVQNVTDGPAEKRCKCEECGNVIEPGEMRRHVFQQEEEECQCDHCQEACDTEESGGCVPDYGESFDADICHACVKMLAAVKAVEVEEGCPEYAQQPFFGQLWDEMFQADDGAKYVTKAREMFPELETHVRFAHLVEHQADKA